MGLGVFFQEDLANILRGVASAGAAYGPVYQKAIGDLALALGVNPRAVICGAVDQTAASAGYPTVTWQVVASIDEGR